MTKDNEIARKLVNYEYTNCLFGNYTEAQKGILPPNSTRYRRSRTLRTSFTLHCLTSQFR